MPSPIHIAGQRVVLHSTIEDNRDSLNQIRETSEVRAHWRGADLDQEFTGSLADDELTQLTIRLEAGAIVGMIQISEEDDPEYRHASIDIYVSPVVHRQGIATDAIQTVLRFLIEERGHHRFTIDPAADNDAAIACYTAIGFKPVGIMRSYELQADGTWGDGLLMDLLASDLNNLKP